MSDIEKLVRPFQLQSTAPARPYPTTTPPANEDNVILSVGGSGQVKVYQINYNFAIQLYMTKQEREVKAT